MYNGIGLQTSRGIGPNGGYLQRTVPYVPYVYVQRNLFFVKQSKKAMNESKNEIDVKISDKQSIKDQNNKQISENQNKRQNDSKCLEMEDQLEQKCTNYKRSVNSVTLSAEQELKRHESQRFCETVSLIAIILGLVLVTITPFLLIPIWVIPNPYSPIIRNILWASMLMTIGLLTLAALTGNIYWYYDEKSQKWKWFYHCGKGPNNHYWGTTLFHNTKLLKRLTKSDRRINVSINV